MPKRPEGTVVILSESDAELLIQQTSELVELIWDMLSRRTVVLRAPTRSRNARVVPLTRPTSVPPAPFDELF